VIAAPNSRFGLPEVNVGLYAGAGGLSRIARSAGLQVASDVALTARQLNAVEAMQWGLISRVSKSQESVVSEAVEVAKVIASKSPDGIIVSRAGIRQAFQTADMERASQITADQYGRALIEGENVKIGLRAFVEKRVPQWIPSRL
jgi:enoyl-CoA hydratase/carnithine racemase